MRREPESRPYLVWITDYPDEGSICVDATNREDAMFQGRDALEDIALPEADQMELTCKVVDAQDFTDMQEALEGGSPRPSRRRLATI